MAVPSLRKMHIEALHPLVTRYEIDVAPVQRVPNVKVATGIGGRRVDTVHLARSVVGIEVVDVMLSPKLAPISLLSSGVVGLAQRVVSARSCFVPGRIFGFLVV
jgi:hypothetical protein